jgi:hypothetical protein
MILFYRRLRVLQRHPVRKHGQKKASFSENITKLAKYTNKLTSIYFGEGITFKR